jgi:hypothetical protein
VIVLKTKLTSSVPDGFYQTTWQWLDVFFHDVHYEEIHPLDKAELTLPKCLKEDWAGVFQQHAELSTFPAYVTAIPNGRFCGGAVISQDNKLILEASNSSRANPSEHWIFQQTELTPVEYRNGNAVVLTTIPGWHHNYYHWMFDVLAKLGQLERSGLTIDWYIIDPRAHPFQYETLHIIGIPEEKIIENQPTLHIQTDQLVLTSQPTLTPAWASRYLSQALKKYSGNPGTRYRKVYISRADAYYRKIINEEKVCKFLEKQGFAVVHLSQLDVKQQIELFSAAEVIISPHGAGLTNLVFTRPGTKVIELFSPDYIHPIYWILSNRVGADYYYLLGNGPQQNQLGWPSCGGEADIEINLEKLQRVLRYVNRKS